MSFFPAPAIAGLGHAARRGRGARRARAGAARGVWRSLALPAGAAELVQGDHDTTGLSVRAVNERCRPVVRGSAFPVARGRVERSGQVVNVRVDGLAPLAFAPSVGHRSRDFH